MFIAHVVILGAPGSDPPTICLTTEFRRLLLHRLEVIEAALQTLIDLQGTAAASPQ